MTREQWRQHVSWWQESGQSAEAYAAGAGLNASTLQHWRWKLGASTKRGSAGAGRVFQSRRRNGEAGFHFVELTPPAVDAGAEGDSSLEIVLSGGRRVRVSAGFDAATLTRVIAAVEAV